MTDRTLIAPLTPGQRSQLEAIAGKATHPADIVIGWWRIALGLADAEWDELGPRAVNPADYEVDPLELRWLTTLLKVSQKPGVAEWGQKAAWAIIQWGPTPRQESVALEADEEVPSPSS